MGCDDIATGGFGGLGDISVTLRISEDAFESAIGDAVKPVRIDLAHAREFALGPLEVIPSLRLVQGPGGEEVIEPKVMQVLIALGDNAGAILSRDDLIKRCWEGRVVGESSINRVISLLRSALRSAAGDDVMLENVPKVGYRIVISPDWTAPDEEGPDESQPATASTSANTASPVLQRWQPGTLGLAAMVLALIAVIGLATALWPSSRETPIKTLTIVMLPLTVDERVDPLYARGLEAELRSQLARVSELEVTSSDSARQLSAEGMSADEVSRRLGADYAWTGSLEVEADRVVLTASLIEASSNQQTYSETFSSAPGNAQTLPLRSARAVSSALGRPVASRMPAVAVSASDYRLYLTALGLIKGRGNEQRIAAHEILTQVTSRNPEFADGWAGLAKATYLYPPRTYDRAEIEAQRTKAGEIADIALGLDEDAVDAIKVKGMLDSTPRDERIALLKRATSLDPGDSEAWFWRSIIQKEFLLVAGNPVKSARHMVDIDPLWPASWRVPDLAAQHGQADLALELEETIAAAAVTPSQKLQSRARTAMLQGDLSGFLEISGEAARTATAAERRYGISLQTRTIALLLGLPGDKGPRLPRGMSGPVIDAVVADRLPSKGAFAASGFGGAAFWDNPMLVELSPPLFVREGREAELAEYYDARFKTGADYLAYARQQNAEAQIIPSLSPYLALAFRKLGREAEADWHIARTREQVERWRKSDTRYVDKVMFELSLAALDNDLDRAAGLTAQLEDYAWPYSMVHVRPSSLFLLRENPLFDRLRKDPRIEAFLAPIRANLAKERAEVMALGGVGGAG